MSAPSRKVLIVDDDPGILQALSRCLRHEFEVDTADSALTALGLVAIKGPYAVVVSDLVMPGKNGLELLTEIAQASPETIRVALTGCIDESLRRATIQRARVFRYLSKPCDFRVFFLTLAEAVERYAEQQAQRLNAPTGAAV